MPVAPKRYCTWPLCPELVEKGESRCPKHRSATRKMEDDERGSATDRGYDAAWRQLRLFILDRDGWCCQVDRGDGTPCYAPANEVDHRLPIEDGLARGVPRAELDDPANLQAICRPCHTAKTAAEKMRRRRGGTI